jgi:ABC-type transport system involved in cytochrome c biogenesis permease subunit
VLFSVPALTLGLVVGLVRLLTDRDHVDAVVVATLATWLVWSAYLVLRVTRGWTGRRAAYVALVGFALVIVVRLALPAAHFS